jgi:hypothetical protein
MKARNIVNEFFIFLILDENTPEMLLSENFVDFDVLDDIMSHTDSASIRSFFPFKKDLYVNSPGEANLAPVLHKSSNTDFIISGFPWTQISTKFSPVYVYGDLKKTHITSSITSFKLIMCPYLTCLLQFELVLNTLFIIEKESSPDIRIIEIAALPAALDNATIVSLIIYE